MVTGIQTRNELGLVCYHVKQNKWVHVLTSLVPSVMPVYRKSRTLSSGVGWQSWNSLGFFSARVICSRLSLHAFSVNCSDS